ncbi:MAG: response regulator transcription factor, partial [Mycobacteriales bacterium]
QAAREVYAFAEQRQMLERALEMWDQVPADQLPADFDHVDLLAIASHAAFKAGDLDRALALIDAAITEVDTGAQADRTAQLHDQRALVLTNLGRPGALEALRAAQALLTDDTPVKIRARVLASLARALMNSALFEESTEVASESARLGESIGEPGIVADANVTLATALVYLDDAETGVARLYDALTGADTLTNRSVGLRARVNLSDGLQRLGHYDDAIAVASEGVKGARLIGRARTTGAFLAGNVIDPLMSLGRWDEADAMLTEALDLRPPGVQALTLHLQRAILAAARGDVETAEHNLPHARTLLSRQPGDAQYAMPLAIAEAHLALIQGDPARALDHLAVPLGAGETGSRRHRWPVAATAARAAADLAARGRDLRDSADVQRAAEVADRVRDLVDTLGTAAPPDVAWQAIARAELGRAAGTEDTRQAWNDAVAAWDQLGSPYPVAYSLFRAAEAGAIAGDRAAAAQAARRAAAIATELRAAPLAAEIDQLALRSRLKLTDAASGTPAKPVDETQRLGLTAREVDVLRAIAAGHSNRQIAEELFISVKTVSVHVSNILAKLGVSGRGEAAAVAHRLRLFDDRLGA